MDIKDFILIGGGLLIVSVVAHGFWLAWRAHRDPLRIDITPEIPRDVDELTLLRGELPNGGGRVVSGDSYEPEQVAFELEPPPVPVLIEPPSEPVPRATKAAAPGRHDHEDVAYEDAEPVIGDADDAARAPTPDDRPMIGPESRAIRRGRQSYVAVEPKLTVEPLETTVEPSDATATSRDHDAERPYPEKVEPARPRRIEGRDRHSAAVAGASRGVATTGEYQAASAVLVITVLARGTNRFGGAELLEVFLDNDLKFGDMNIFHRLDPVGRTALFSVANAVEPGTFDLSDMTSLQTPGISFFLQLAGLDEPGAAFDDMLFVARDLAAKLGGDLKDEDMSVMTAQTVEHYRQRIVDFSLKRMSKRA